MVGCSALNVEGGRAVVLETKSQRPRNGRDVVPLSVDCICGSKGLVPREPDDDARRPIGLDCRDAENRYKVKGVEEAGRRCVRRTLIKRTAEEIGLGLHWP